MTYLNHTACCGLDEIDGIDDTPKNVLVSVCEDKYPDREWAEDGDQIGQEQAFILFTDNVSDNNYGVNLAKYIKKNKLGTFTATRARENPNTGNMVRVWVWSPNEKNLKAWYNAL